MADSVDTVPATTHHPWVRTLAADRDVAAFRERLRREGAPLVERLGPDHVAVTFVDEPGPDTDSVRLSLLIGYNTVAPEFTPVPGTPFHALTLPMASNLLLSYGFERRWADGSTQLDVDPFNPPRQGDERLAASVLALPDSPELPWLASAERQPQPRVTETVVTSAALGNERRIWVSLPPGGEEAGRPLPFVILFDGTPAHYAPRVRDALVREGRIRPCAVVLVDQIGLRDQELTFNPSFSRMLVDELVPWLREHHPLSGDPHEVALSGSSFGGLCAGWTALQHPEVFGAAIMQSPSCWYHPDRVGVADPPLLRRQHMLTPRLISDFAARDPVPVRIFHECGILEDGPPPAQLRHVFGHRWLRDVLIMKGYDAVYREFPGGHDAAWWRETWADALQWVFPPEEARHRP